MVMRLSGLVQTGDLQSVIYDLSVRLDWCSVAACMAHADHLCTIRIPQLATSCLSVHFTHCTRISHTCPCTTFSMIGSQQAPIFALLCSSCRRCSFMWQMREVTKNRDPTMHMIGRLSSWIWQTCLSSPGQLHRRTNLHRKDAVFVQCMRTACA